MKVSIHLNKLKKEEFTDLKFIHFFLVQFGLKTYFNSKIVPLENQIHLAHPNYIMTFNFDNITLNIDEISEIDLLLNRNSDDFELLYSGIKKMSIPNKSDVIYIVHFFNKKIYTKKVIDFLFKISPKFSAILKKDFMGFIKVDFLNKEIEIVNNIELKNNFFYFVRTDMDMIMLENFFDISKFKPLQKIDMILEE